MVQWVGLFLCFVTSALVASTQEETYSTQESGPVAQVKVLLKKNVEGALIEVKGGYDVIDPFTQKKVSNGFKGKRFYLYPHSEGIKWGEDFAGIYQIKITPKDPVSSVLVDGIQYKGNLEIYHVDNKITIINEVDAENYLKSVLSNPSFESYESSVIDAIAIAARTQIYYQIQHHDRAFWHIDAKESNYKGHALAHFSPKVIKSVDNTRFLVMTYEKKTFPTTWNENCAGKTASYSAVFRKNSSAPTGTKSVFAEKTRKDHHWSFTIPKAKLANLAQTNRITELDLYVDPLSEKVYAVRIQDGSHVKEMHFFDLQKGLGKSNLLSNDFTVSIEGNNITFDGYGEGCGVGLCLFSAKEMAKRGDTAPEILSVFYPYTHVEQIRTLPADPSTQLSSAKLRKIKNKELENF